MHSAVCCQPGRKSIGRKSIGRESAGRESIGDLKQILM